MITPAYAQTMARYSSWQNENIYDAASRLDDDQRKLDRRAFFGSIHATLNHILWADQMWLMRFGAAEPPATKSIAEGKAQFQDWAALRDARSKFDVVIQSWVDRLRPGDLIGDLTWFSAGAGRELTSPRALLIMHLFNHQTHHRGQIHALLTGFGVKPGVTDLPFGAIV